MKISYSRFWDNLDTDNNWFNYMFMEYFNDETIQFSKEHSGSDIIVINSSTVPEELPEKPIKIFFTGEPNKNGYDKNTHILLGFDKTDYGKKIYRLPLWYIYLNWWPEKFKPRQVKGGNIHNFDIKKLCSTASEEDINKYLNRKNFACMVVSHFGINRLETYNMLSKINTVDGYGDAFNNSSNMYKLDILKNYKFNICFENTIDYGYVTEKLLEAKLGGCIPIYWGSSLSKKDFNPKCFINYTDMSSISELESEVNKIYSSEDLLAERFSEPLFNSPPSLDSLFEFLDTMGLKG
jgi:hypothetical protein